MNLQEKLMTIQTKLKAPKNQRNSFGNYNYRSCEDILEAVKPLLSETKTALTIRDEMVCVGSRIYVKASACLHDTESDTVLTNDAFAREPEQKKGMDDSQITGAASSYARKYALNGLFAIDDTRDADAEPEQHLTCEQCGKPIIPIKTAARQFSAQEVAQNTKNTYGRQLCWSCARASKNGSGGQNEISD